MGQLAIHTHTLRQTRKTGKRRESKRRKKKENVQKNKIVFMQLNKLYKEGGKKAPYSLQM